MPSTARLTTRPTPRPTPAVLAVVALGGAAGAMLRHTLDTWAPTSTGSFPWTTFAINVVGSFLLALLPVAVLARTAFGMPWEVEVRDTDAGVVWPVVHTEQVKGWGASGVRIADLAEEIRLGRFTLEPPGTQSGS